MAVNNTETAPVGSFAANPFGLYDTTGNAWSWVSDCWNSTYDTAPTDGSANLSGDCAKRVERGGSWFYVPGNLRSATRQRDQATLRNYHNGFRVALTL
jgi:formylglycine-generating enzyme required for sulfatase activity